MGLVVWTIANTHSLMVSITNYLTPILLFKISHSFAYSQMVPSIAL